MSKALTVSQLNRLARDYLAMSPSLSNVQVEGELSSAKLYPSGHFYFTLKDANSSVSAVMFKNSIQVAKELPKIGEEVIVSGGASIYERDGRFQLIVYEINLKGKGNLFIQFERLKKELEQLGYFSPQRKKKLPKIPACIGVVTSSEGAVLRDIVHVLRRRFPGFSLRLISTKVQGKGAAEEIAAAIHLFNRYQLCDLMIVGRGGGSMEDLWCFNERVVADAVYQSNIPIISAVGHETDFTICDFCSDQRAPTPSAAAEIAFPVKEDLLYNCKKAEEWFLKKGQENVLRSQREIRLLEDRLVRAMDHLIQSETQRLDFLLESPVLKQATAIIDLARERLENKRKQLVIYVDNLFATRKREINELEHKLEILSPWKILRRGYTAISDEEGNIISSAGKLKENQRIELRFQDGRVKGRLHDLQLIKAVNEKE